MELSSLSYTQQKLFHIYYWYSRILGLLSYVYDSKTHQIKQTRTSRIYSVTVNVLMICLCPFQLVSFVQVLQDQEWPLLMKICGWVNCYNSLLSIVYTICIRTHIEKFLWDLSWEWTEIDKNLFQKEPLQNVETEMFLWLVYRQYGVTFLLTFVNVVSVVVNTKAYEKGFLYILLAVFFGNAMNVPKVSILNYFNISWSFFRGFYSINKLLAGVLKRSNFSKLLPSIRVQTRNEMSELIQLYWRLFQMFENINHFYRYLMLATRFKNTIDYSIIGYFYYVYFTRSNSPGLMIMFIILFLSLFFSEIYFFDSLSDKIITESQKTLFVLRLWNSSDNKDIQFIQMVEEFSLELCTFRIRIQPCGLFSINKESWFSMSAKILSLSIVLIQIHKIM